MEKSSKVALIIGCVLIVLFFIFTRKYIVKTDKIESTLNISNNIIKNEVSSNISGEENQNEEQENKIEENSSNVENATIENSNNISNNITENNTNSQVQGLEEKTSANEEKLINKKDEALRLVEEEWGEDSTVYYTIDNDSGNVYSISVRSKSSTAVLQEYEVDVTKGIVTLK